MPGMRTRITPTVGAARRYGRNDPCPCGSGRKAKRCHLAPGGPPDGVTVLLGGAVTEAPGEAWDGKTRGEVVAYLDAGAGDAIHAMRFVHQVEENASRVWWVVRPSMLALFKRSFPNSRHVTAVHPVPRTARFRTTTFEMIEHGVNFGWPRPIGQYLLIDPEEGPRDRSDRSHPDYLRAGLCIHGDSTQSFDRWRSIHDERVVQPLVRTGGVLWTRFDTPRWARRPWLETAQYVTGMDVVVSVDTAVAHLAGALGVPLILLDRAGGPGDPGPDDRWDDGYLQNGPLYRRVTRIRQVNRDEGWAAVIDAARRKVEEMVGPRSSSGGASGGTGAEQWTYAPHYDLNNPRITGIQ